MSEQYKDANYLAKELNLAFKGELRAIALDDRRARVVFDEYKRYELRVDCGRNIAVLQGKGNDEKMEDLLYRLQVFFDLHYPAEISPARAPFKDMDGFSDLEFLVGSSN